MPILSYDIVGAGVVVDNVYYGRGVQCQLDSEHEVVVQLAKSGHLREVPGQWAEAEALDVEDLEESE